MLMTPAVSLRFPSCGLLDLADLLGADRKALHARYRVGELEHLVMRTVSGGEWRPTGRIEFDALRIRPILDDDGQQLFDAWQSGSVALGRPARKLAREAAFPANAQSAAFGK